MIANNPCRHLISKLVEHLTDAVLFLTNILPPPSKCTVLFRNGGGGGDTTKQNKKIMNKTKNSYEIRFFFPPTCTVFSKHSIKSHLLSAVKLIATCKFYFHIFWLLLHNMGTRPQLCSVISLLSKSRVERCRAPSFPSS